VGRRPVIVVADPHEEPRGRVVGALERRLGGDYRVLPARTGAEAIGALRAPGSRGDEVALVLADHELGEPDALTLLAEVPALDPRARRGLMIEFGGWRHRATADAVLRAMSLGRCDYYVLKPWRSPDEFFHRSIAEFLHEWSRSATSGPSEVVVIGGRDRRTREISALLSRSGIPSSVSTPEERAGPPPSRLPAVAFHDGRVLERPSNAEIAAAFGFGTSLVREDHDVVIVGAGPGGLAAAVYAASEGLRVLVVESEAIGGQAGSSSLIRNYLGFPRGVTGGELAMRAYQQAWVFGTHFVLMREVAGIETDGDRLRVLLSDGSAASAGAVVLAMGVDYRRLESPALEAHIGTGVFYGASVPEAQALSGRPVVVVGGGNSAGQAAVHLARYASSVTVVVRGESLRAGMSRYLIDVLAAAPNVTVRSCARVVDAVGEGRLEGVVLEDVRDGSRAVAEAAGLFVMIGARPRTDWLPDVIGRDEGGAVLTGADVPAGRWTLERPARPLETSVPGVFAVGDVRHGSMRRVAAAVGDGAAVMSQIHRHLETLLTTP
jgi:thioredoxin reductase (NADPH)